MNRKPRTEEELYRWHSETLAYIAANGEAARGRPPVHEDDPQCGWYRRRLVPKGPFYPARVWLQPGDKDPETGELLSPEKLLCEVDGKRVPVDRAWTWIARHPISEDQYMEMLAGGFRGLGDPAPSAPPAPAQASDRDLGDQDIPIEPPAPGAAKTCF